MKKTKFENNWLSKSLESLEKDFWEANSDDTSYLVKTCFQLRKKQLKDFDVEDLRIMIGQNIGLTYLIPLALDKLKENILAEGDYYPGDLLKSVLTSKESYWLNEINNWKLLCDLFEKEVLSNQFSYDDFDDSIFKVFSKFKTHN